MLKSARAKNFQIYGVPLLSLVAFLTIVPTLLNTFRDRPPDFTMFIMSARWLRQGLDPYRELLALHGGNTNPPATLFAMVPLTFLPIASHSRRGRQSGPSPWCSAWTKLLAP